MPLKKVVHGNGDYLKNDRVEYEIECAFDQDRRTLYHNGTKLEFKHLLENIKQNQNITEAVHSDEEKEETITQDDNDNENEKYNRFGHIRNQESV